MESKKEKEAGEFKGRIGEELRKWWKFDNTQRPLASWHDREDFIEKILSNKTK